MIFVQRRIRSQILAGLLVALILSLTSAFTPPFHFEKSRQCVGTIARKVPRFIAGQVTMPSVGRQRNIAFMSAEDGALGSDEEEPAATAVEDPPAPTGTEYPIDLPSPILLSTSMILAMVSTGEHQTFRGSTHTRSTRHLCLVVLREFSFIPKCTNAKMYPSFV